ncbi:MAG: pilus assembly protein PilM [Candidatus Coatesbacteria bacterium]|nr:pilus assembly protein PilM [Candidatus Coatesbacteria bacterium]
MAKTVIGIDIDASSVKVIEIEPGKETAVKAFGISHLEFKEKPSDEELVRAQTEALSEAIASLPPRKKFDNVVSLVSGREVRTRILSFPPMPRKEVAGVVEREVRKDAAVPIEDLIYDYSLLRMVRERGQDKQQVMIVSVNRDLVFENIGVLRTFGILPAAISTSSTGLYSALARTPLWSGEEAVGLVDIGANICTMLIFGSETLYFQREIFTGYNEMKAAFEEGEEEGGEMDFGPGVGGGPSSIEEIPALQRVATELKRSFLYYKQQFRGNIIKKLYVSGEGTRLPRVDEFLAEGLEDVEINLFNPVEGLNLEALGSQATELETLAPRFATCIGLALEPPKLIRINLVPPEIKAQAYIAIKRFVYSGLVVFVIGILAIAYMLLKSERNKARDAYDIERGKYEELKPGLEELKGVNGQIARYQSYSDLLNKLTKNEPLWTDVYENIGTLVSENMHLDNLKINRLGQSTKGRGGRRGMTSGPGVESSAGWEMVVEGYAYDDSQVGLQERITRFLNRLQESPFFEKVYLDPLDETVERVKGDPILTSSKGAKDPERLLTEALTTIYSDVVDGTYKQKFRIFCRLEGQAYWDLVRRRG